MRCERRSIQLVHAPRTALEEWQTQSHSDGGEGDLEVHLRLGALLADSGVRDAAEVPDDRLVGQVKGEGVDESVQHDLCERHDQQRISREVGRDTHSSRAART